MKRSYKVISSIIAIIASIVSASIGVGYVGGSSQSFLVKFLCDFAFIITPISTIWLVIALIRKGK